MIKKLVFIFFALFAIQNHAQEGTASPYSFYGIGSLKFKGTAENNAMGGVGVYKDSVHINLQNPATYGGKNLSTFNNESRPVKFTVGGSHNSTRLHTYTTSEKGTASTFDYLAISIPVGKFGFGFGLLPYTSVGYKLQNKNSKGLVSDLFSGSGGVNKTYLSLGYEFKNGLSIGIEGNYNFGTIMNETVRFGYNEEGESIQKQTIEDNRSDLSGFDANLGIHYYRTIYKNLELQSSVTYSPEGQLGSKNQRFLSVRNLLASNPIPNVKEVDLQAKGLKTTDIVLPTLVSGGLGIGEPKKWFASAEYTWQNFASFDNKFLQNNITAFQDASELAFGGFYIPKYNSPNKYWKRVVYRAGVRTAKTGLNINGKSIEEFGMSFGLGLPVGRLFSNANFTFEYGTKGTTTADLVRENFMNFQISLSLNDRWFVKRKYD